ncbi:MAG: NusG domain II-containing protein [Treponema sp.]|nr:NusG domain II-containing protein [Treponema sp.]
MKVCIKIPDVLIVLIAVSLIFFSFYTVYFKPQGAARVLIRGQNAEWIFPIETEETIVVSGPLGETTVRLRGKSAWIDSSPCDNQTCVAAGEVSGFGQWAACLPNNVLLLIDGTGDTDAISW